MIPPMLPLDWDAMEKDPWQLVLAFTKALEVHVMNLDDWDLQSRVLLLGGAMAGTLMRLKEEKAALQKAYDDTLVANMRGSEPE